MIDISQNNNTLELFTIILSSRLHHHYGELLNVSNMKFVDYLNEPKELSFEIDKYSNGIEERLWNDIVNFKYIYVKELNTYFEIYVAISEKCATKKIVTSRSACECELSQLVLYNIEINTETDIERLDYKPTVFYNPDKPNASLLHRILEKSPSYTIKHVDNSLANIQRSFSVNDKSIYDFFIDECASEFNCIFMFDSVERSISVYDLYTVCNDCGYRGEYTDECPKCGGHNLKYFGEDTTILVTSDNLTDEIKFETNTDQIKNCYVIEAGDDATTAAALTYIPNGGNCIYYVPKEQMMDMNSELANKIRSYNSLYDSTIGDYHALMERIYECIEGITYYTSRQMPDTTISNTTAATEAAKLTVQNLSPLSLSSLTTYTTIETINNALINYAQVYVRSGFVKIEIDTCNYTYNGVSNGINYGTWTGRIKVTNYSDKSDIAYSDSLTIIINDDYMSFINEKILKNLANNNNKDGSIYDVLSIKNLDGFSTALKLYGLNRLISFRDAINGVLNILIEVNGGDPKSELYTPFYSHYYNKLTRCNNEISLRKDTISDLEAQKANYELQLKDIQNRLNLRNYLGEELYRNFTVYLREEKYKNDNYISDGLSTEALFKVAQEFLAKAREELIKASHYQHSITANMHNLLLLDEFAPIVDHFRLGNWIRVQVDDKVYRLRLVSYALDFNNPCNLDTEFSDVTRTANNMNDVYGVLKKTKPIVSTYQNIAKQAIDGKTAADILEKLKNEGISSGDYPIGSDDSKINFDNDGITGNGHEEPDNGFKINGGNISYTDDKWETVKNLLGKIQFTIDGILKNGYGVNADYCISGTVVAGNIYSSNYSSGGYGVRFNLDNGTFTLGDGRIVFDGNVLRLRDVEIDWSTTNQSQDMWASIQANAEGISSEVLRAKKTEEELEATLSSKITQTASEIRTEVNNIEEELSSSITQTYMGIMTEVTSVYEKKADADEKFETKRDASLEYEEIRSSITQTADTIRSDISKYYITKTDAETSFNQLSSAIIQTESSIKSEVSRQYLTKTDAQKSFTELSSTITQTAEKIESKVSKGELSSLISQEAGGIDIEGDRFTLNSSKLDITAKGDIWTTGIIRSTNVDGSAELVLEDGFVSMIKDGTSAGRFAARPGYNGVEMIGNTIVAVGTYQGTGYVVADTWDYFNNFFGTTMFNDSTYD